MTVAIAAMCGVPNGPLIIGAEDHMVTSGDIEFEQPQPKMWRLSPACAAMFYGLSAVQAHIAELTEAHVRNRSITNVRAMTDSYAWFLQSYIRQEAEIDILGPLGLRLADLYRNPPTINQATARRLSQQIQSYYDRSGLGDNLGGAIIVGADADGAHIFKVEHGHVTSLDNIGFVAAGGGQWHAESQFMFSRYTRFWDFPDALSLVYAAKKRAEVAPGVGNETDIIVVTTSPPNLIHAKYDSDLVIGLEKIYQEYQQKQEENFIGQHKGVKAFIDALLKIPEPEPNTGSSAAPVATGEVGTPQQPSRQARQQPPPGSKRGRKLGPPSPE